MKKTVKTLLNEWGVEEAVKITAKDIPIASGIGKAVHNVLSSYFGQASIGDPRFARQSKEEYIYDVARELGVLGSKKDPFYISPDVRKEIIRAINKALPAFRNESAATNKVTVKMNETSMSSVNIITGSITDAMDSLLSAQSSAQASHEFSGIARDIEKIIDKLDTINDNVSSLARMLKIKD